MNICNEIHNIEELCTGQKLYKKAKRLIPGGTQLLSKRPEMFAPDIWPAYYSKAKGYNVWDLDGTEYVDMSIMGVGANILGYADDDVDNAVIDAIKKGSSSSLNCPEEVELAEKLIELHPWADMVRFSRSGGEATSMAIRIARAATGKEIVLFSGYHGWCDWYLSANLSDNDNLDGQLLPGLEPAGIPRGLTGTALPFHFNDMKSLSKAIEGNENNIAAIIVEPARGADASKEFLLTLKAQAKKLGAVLIFDEITSAFRMCAGGIHRLYGVEPDIAVFAKSLGNGYPIAAILGVEAIMQAAQSTFISSTNWTERIGPVAALATISKYMKANTAKHIIEIGEQVKTIWKTKANKYGLLLKVSGISSLPGFSFDSRYSREMSTLFTTEMLKIGFLGFRQFKPALVHDKACLEMYADGVDQVFELLCKHNYSCFPQEMVAHTGFARLTKE